MLDLSSLRAALTWLLYNHDNGFTAKPDPLIHAHLCVLHTPRPGTGELLSLRWARCYEGLLLVLDRHIKASHRIQDCSIRSID